MTKTDYFLYMNNLKEEMKNNFQMRPVFDDLEQLSARIDKSIRKSKSEVSSQVDQLKLSC